MNYIVTTTHNPTNDEIDIAKKLAKKIGASYIDRGNSTISYLNRLTSTVASLVVKGNSLEFIKEGKRLFFHPNLAVLRVMQLEKGHRDRLIDLIGLKEGDSILDATCGMGSDSIVLSYSVGISGKVTALESSGIVYEIVKRGFKSYKSSKIELDKVMSRIELINRDYNYYLSSLNKNSYDYIYFDPMFESTREESKGLNMIKELADYQPLTIEALNNAKRVAKKAVLVKDNRNGSLLKRLNIPIVSTTGRITYGKISVN